LSTTVFDSTLAVLILQPVARLLLKLVGWRRIGVKPPMKQAIIIGAHHTSNWDFVLALIFAFDLGVAISWMGKDSLFNWPLGGLFRWLGGIPIDRSRSSNMVEASIRELKAGNIGYLVVTPEGTRSKRERWKTGFYHIATGANVPILLGFLDFKEKKVGLGPTIYPTGELEADLDKIREFYDTITAKFPEKVTRACL
jgi:1-acyl-sn-glycerol-3-phosphate acyltransferase